MIVSRAAELSRLDDLLTALAGGEGSALVVRGEAGIGKTTLLDALAARSGDAVTVIRACGAETEAELTFSALADLLDPVLGELPALPEPQVGPGSRPSPDLRAESTGPSWASAAEYRPAAELWAAVPTAPRRRERAPAQSLQKARSGQPAVTLLRDAFLRGMHDAPAGR